jgi:hypothetical protein
VRFCAELLSPLWYWLCFPHSYKLNLADSSVDGSFLKPYKNAWKVVYAFPGKDSFLVGTWTDELAAMDVKWTTLAQTYPDGRLRQVQHRDHLCKCV